MTHGRLLLDSTLGSGTTAKVVLPLARSVASAAREAELLTPRSH